MMPCFLLWLVFSLLSPVRAAFFTCGWLNAVQTNNGTINYAYDAAGNRTQVRITGRDGGVRVTNYAYDALNRVSTVSRVGVGTLANYSYTAVGNVDHVFRANGVKSTFGYDELHRLTAIEHKKGTKVLSQFNYALSADGKRNTVQEYIDYPAEQPVASVNRTVFYGYDAAGRLNAEQRQSTSTLTAGGSIAKTARTIWSYDKVGNRLTQAVSNYDGIGVPGDPGATGVLKSTFNTTYNYNINDWLTSTTSIRNDGTDESTFVTNFEYNQNGSQSAVISNVGKPDEKRTPYFYDFEQKLTSIGNPTDAVKHAYWYDADGNRIAESNTNAGNTTIRHYLVDPNNSNAQIVEEYDNTNTLLAHYDWNDAELLREASWNASTNAYDIHEPVPDGHNNIRQLLDSSGSISNVYAFDAWGNQQINIGGSFNPYQYNSQRLDKSGLYYLRARQYSSGIGRFISHDPLMGTVNNPITQHPYLYAGDDAVNFVDPSGEFFNTRSVSLSAEISSVLDSIELDSTLYIGGSAAARLSSISLKLGLAATIAIGAGIDEYTSNGDNDQYYYRGIRRPVSFSTPGEIRIWENAKRGLVAPIGHLNPDDPNAQYAYILHVDDRYKGKFNFTAWTPRKYVAAGHAGARGIVLGVDWWKVIDDVYPLSPAVLNDRDVNGYGWEEQVFIKGKVEADVVEKMNY